MMAASSRCKHGMHAYGSSTHAHCTSRRAPLLLPSHYTRVAAVASTSHASAASQQEQQPALVATGEEHASTSSNVVSSSHASRRGLLLGAAASSSAFVVGQAAPPAAQAVVFAPQGYRTKDDKLDGYTFFYPEGWLAVSSSGNDCFLRNPRNIDENLFVDITSPSSSKFESITELGTPEEAAAQKLDQFLNKEFMSTRLGIRREGKVLYATTREGPDGRTYYDIGIRMSSYGSTNPYVATQGEVMQEYGLEWDRVLLTTLGVANKRIYELRIQTAQETYGPSEAKLLQIKDSFKLRDVDTAGS